MMAHLCAKGLLDHTSIVFHDAYDHFCDLMELDFDLGLVRALEIASDAINQFYGVLAQTTKSCKQEWGHVFAVLTVSFFFPIT